MRFTDSAPVIATSANANLSSERLVHLRALCFMPYLSQEFRLLFHQKRMELGLTYRRLGGFFLTNWSTIRKWELGLTRRCNDRVRPLLFRFLSGAADRELLSDARSCLPGAMGQELPPLVRNYFQGYLDTYMLCRTRPALQEEMLHSLNAITRNVIDCLLSPGGAAPSAPTHN